MLTALIGIWLAMWIARGTPTGAAMHRVLVERPAAWLARIRRSDMLLWLVILTVTAAVIWLLDNEGRVILSMGLPEFASFAAAVDVSALLDLAVVAIVAATTIRVRAIRTWLGGKIAPRRPRARRPHVRRTRKPANDDEERPALAA